MTLFIQHTLSYCVVVLWLNTRHILDVVSLYIYTVYRAVLLEENNFTDLISRDLVHYIPLAGLISACFSHL